MIDEAKAKAAQQKKDMGPSKKDTNLPKKVLKPIKKDSVFYNDSVVRKIVTRTGYQ